MFCEITHKKYKTKKLAFYFLLSLIKILIGSAFIGIFHASPYTVALTLALYIIYKLNKIKKYQDINFKLYIIGLLTTGTLGLITEYLGTHLGFWHYLDLLPQVTMPVWLIFAWPLVYVGLYQLEYNYCGILKLNSFTAKLQLTMLNAFLLPIAGEMLAINLGTWVYHMPLQSIGLLGVPVIAMVLLMIFHTVIFILLSMLAKTFKLHDRVYFTPPQRAE